MTKSVVLGIAGGTGSGKTTVAREIVHNELVTDRIAYLEHDAYYRDLGHLSREDRRRVNFDHPDAFETELLVEHIKTLLSGQHIEQPIYSYADSVRTGEVRRVEPKPLVVVERYFSA